MGQAISEVARATFGKLATGYNSTTATPIPTIQGGKGGVLPLLDFTKLPAAGAGLGLDFAGDYYYRIWVLPPELVALNPRIGVPIKFKLWNAFPWPNAVRRITSTDGKGLDLNLNPNTNFRDLEIKEPEITITSSAPPNIATKYTFAFDWGDGILFFRASVANILAGIPEFPIIETWTWKTDILRSFNATEQRVALRSTPRRATTMTLLVHSKEEWREKYLTLFSKLATRITVPHAQYMTRITQDSAAGETEIWFDSKYTDLRVGEYVLLVDPQTEAMDLQKIGELTDNGARLDQLLSFPVYKDMIVMPGCTSRIADGTAIEMGPLVGKTVFKSECLDVRSSLRRPGSTAVIESLHDYPVLDRRPLASKGVGTIFTSGYQVIDGGTGLQDIRTAWNHAYASGIREFLIQRLFDPDEMDWWRDFLSLISGMQKPFLASTWRSDFDLAEAIQDNATQVKLLDQTYASTYNPWKCCQYLQFEPRGAEIFRRRVLSVKEDPDTGIATVEVEGGMPATPKDTIVSFLHLCRLDSDEVTLEHHQTYTLISMNIRMVDQ